MDRDASCPVILTLGTRDGNRYSLFYTLQAVMLACLSCQHPPFLSRHSLVSTSDKLKPGYIVRILHSGFLEVEETIASELHIIQYQAH